MVPIIATIMIHSSSLYDTTDFIFSLSISAIIAMFIFYFFIFLNFFIYLIFFFFL